MRRCTTSRQVAGLIPGGVIGIIHWLNPSDRSVALWTSQLLIEMSTSGISWEGVEEGQVRRPDNLTTFMCRLSRNSRSLSDVHSGSFSTFYILKGIINIIIVYRNICEVKYLIKDCLSGVRLSEGRLTFLLRSHPTGWALSLVRVPTHWQGRLCPQALGLWRLAMASRFRNRMRWSLLIFYPSAHLGVARIRVC